MCMMSRPSTSAQNTPTPAPAPNAPLPAPDVPRIGDTRREENIQNFGSERPNYRVRRPRTKPEVSPQAPILM